MITNCKVELGTSGGVYLLLEDGGTKHEYFLPSHVREHLVRGLTRANSDTKTAYQIVGGDTIEITHAGSTYQFPIGNLREAITREKSIAEILARFDDKVASLRLKVVRGEGVDYRLHYPPA